MAGHGQDWQRLGDESLPTEDSDIGLGHIVPLKIYDGTFISLILLTGITVWIAQYDFGVLNLGVAMGVATTKAAIVTLFFMHLSWESKITWGIVIYPLFIFALILLGTLGDASLQTNPPRIDYSQTSSSSTAEEATIVEGENQEAASVGEVSDQGGHGHEDANSH